MSYAREFESQFKDMEKQLTLMQGFVTDTEELKEKSETVRIISNALRELLYDADDLVIDCLIHADYRRMRESSSSCFRISLGDLFFRYQTGKKLACINRNITKERENLSKYLSPRVEQPNNDGSSNRPARWTSQLFDQSEIVGLDKDAITIKGWIFSQSEVPHRIGIVGMGGVGKTTLTQKIFNDKHVQAHFESRIWLSITETFSEIGIMRSILKKLNKDDSGSEGDLQTRIHEALSDTRYLIVLDDVWNLKNGWWERFSHGLPKKRNSCIIITSRNEDVVKQMEVVEARIHRHKTLEDKDSWSLFCKVAFKATKGTCEDSQLKEIGEKIAKKCDGLPLAIRAVGGLLSSNVMRSEWKRICENFSDMIAKVSDAAVMVSLQLSYDELSTRLKHCLLSFSVFPEDYEISTEQLARWWVGEV